jgi:heparin binding hemagglutinin HbhA
MAFSAPEPGDAPAGTNGTTASGDQHRPAPLMAMLGAGDAAVAAVARAFADAYAAAASRRETVQHRVAGLPAEFETLRTRFSGDELRHALDTYRAQVERAYAQFAGRGAEAWDKLREKPQVRQAMTRLESYSEKLDFRVDDAQEAASRALAAAGRQSRVAGEKVAKAGQRVTGRAADAVVDASAAAADAVEEAGTATAGVIEDAGDEAAAATRKATGSAEEVAQDTAGSTAPKAAGRPAPKRTPSRPASS